MVVVLLFVEWIIDGFIALSVYRYLVLNIHLGTNSASAGKVQQVWNTSYLLVTKWRVLQLLNAVKLLSLIVLSISVVA